MSSTTYGAFLDGRLVGKRTTKTMAYTHAVVVTAGIPGADFPVAASYSQSMNGAQKLLGEYLRHRPDHKAVVVPVFAIDKSTLRPLDPNVMPVST